MTTPVSTWENVKFAWPVLVSLAAGPAFLVAAVLGAPKLVTVPLAVVMIGGPSLCTYVWLRKQEGLGRGAALASAAGGLLGAVFLGTFVVGLALCATLTVLFVIGGLSDGVFHDEDVVLLIVSWSLLTLIWLASRYIRASVRRKARNA
jgi:hypothetical protein